MGFFMPDSVVPDLVFASLLSYLLLYVYVTRNFNFWMKRGVFCLKPLAFLGNFGDVVLSRMGVAQLVEGFYRGNEGKPFVGFFSFDRPVLLVRDPAVVRHVLVKDFAVFHDRNFTFIPELDPIGAKCLFGLHGERWKIMRHKLTPTFTSGKMKRMFHLVSEIGKELATYIEERAESGKPLPVKETMACYTTDVIASCALGIRSNSIKDPNDTLRAHVRRANHFDLVKAFKFLAVFFAPSVLKTLNIRVADGKFETYLREAVLGAVEYREKNGVTRNDFLDLLIQLKNEGEVAPEEGEGDAGNLPKSDKLPFSLEGDDLVAQCFIFLIAGFDTSSCTLTFTLYELAKNQDIQTKVRQEIAKFGGSFTYEAVANMSYLHTVVSETLRYYPIVPFLERRTMCDYTIPGSDVTVPEGTCVMISVKGLHMDPNYHPEPETFNPERFSEENKSHVQGYTYMPFGEGPHNCIGESVYTNGKNVPPPRLSHSLSLDKSCVIEPVHVLPPPRSVKASEWQDVPLEVPQESNTKTPVPPPRKKRSRRTGAAAVSTPTLTPPPKPPHPPHRSISTIVRPSIDDSQLLKPRHKNISTVSLPNYEELEINIKKDNNKCLLKPENPSLGASMSSVSEATLERLETYLRRCKSFSSIAAEQIVDQLNRSAAESSDDDSLDDDWGLGVIEHPISPGEGPPLSPTHQLPVKRKKSRDTPSPSSDSRSITTIADSQSDKKSADVTTDTKKPEIEKKKLEDNGKKDDPELEAANRFFDDEEVVSWFQKDPEESGTDKVDEELKTIVYDFSSKRDLNSKAEGDKKSPSVERKKKISTESKTPPPSPEAMDFLEVDEASSKITRSGTPTCFLTTGHVSHGEKETSDKLQRVLNEFCESSNRVLTDGDAEDILKELGLPMDLKDEVEKWQKRKRSTICPPDSSGLNSGRSSTTPSLSELEAAISDLLEKNNKCGEDEDDNVAPKSAFIPVPSNLPPSGNNNDNSEKNKNNNHIILKPVPIISVSSEPFTN